MVHLYFAKCEVLTGGGGLGGGGLGTGGGGLATGGLQGSSKQLIIDRAPLAYILTAAIVWDPCGHLLRCAPHAFGHQNPQTGSLGRVA